MALVAVLATGCSGTEPVSYSPLEQGTRWEYTLEINAAGQKMGARMTSEVEGTEVIDGTQYVQIVNLTTAPGAPSAQREVQLFRATDDAVYFVEEKHKDHAEQVYLPAAPKVGDEWTVHTPVTDIDYRVVALEDIDVLGKTYADCIKVTFDGISMETPDTLFADGVIHYAPGIGQVQMKMNGRSRPGEMTMSLKLKSFWKATHP